MRVVDVDSREGTVGSGRPLPEVDNVSSEFWASAARGALVVQRCTVCGCHQFYPRPMCTQCAGDVEWTEVSGEGTVYTFTVIRQNLAPPFDAVGSYVVAMIQLAEGPLMMSNITDIDPADVTVGLPVTAYAVKVEDNLAIPFWRPTRSAAGSA